jgi:hypothetical protein
VPGPRRPGGLVTADSRGFSFLTTDGEVLDRVEVLAPGQRVDDVAETGDNALRQFIGPRTMEFEFIGVTRGVNRPGGHGRNRADI